jgi:hypothetical protein
MRRQAFLTAGWVEQFNSTIRAEPRQVIFRGDPRVWVRVVDGPDRRDPILALDIDDDRPVLRLGADGRPADAAAQIRVSYPVLRQVLVDGDLPAARQAINEGTLEADGERETLLYYLYHLFPGGPAGAARLATTVAGFTE